MLFDGFYMEVDYTKRDEREPKSGKRFRRHEHLHNEIQYGHPQPACYNNMALYRLHSVVYAMNNNLEATGSSVQFRTAMKRTGIKRVHDCMERSFFIWYALVCLCARLRRCQNFS